MAARSANASSEATPSPSLSAFLSKPAIEVAAALIEEEGKYLVTQRRPDDHLGLFWEFPGGKKEAGESLEACLRRELLEELGVIVQVDSFEGQLSYEYSDRKVILHFYHCHILKGEPQTKDCHDFRWVEPDEMKYEDFPPADVSMIRKLQEKMQDEKLYKAKGDK